LAFTINKIFILLQFKYIHTFWYLPYYTWWKWHQNLSQHCEVSPHLYCDLSGGRGRTSPCGTPRVSTGHSGLGPTPGVCL